MSRSMSPTREVAPKLVMGSKKYGRRSRPQINEKSEASQSEGEEEQSQSEEEEDQDQIEGQGTNKVHRSASQTDVKRRRQPQVASSKLKRCASLPARRNMAREFVRIRGSSPTASNKNVKAPLDSSVESLDASGGFSPELPKTDHKNVPCDVVVELLEAAGISNAQNFVKYELGFDQEIINMSQLGQVIDEELPSCTDHNLMVRLMRAALVVAKADLEGLSLERRQMHEENMKLRASNQEANRRVALMAQEVDERHANMEKATQNEIRSLEQKHAESFRELSKQLEQDREQWSVVNGKLEARIKALEAEEVKLRAENVQLGEKNARLEGEQQQQQRQMAELLETNIRLNTDICELEEQQNAAELTRTERENEEVLELMEKITRLQVENTDLRDRNDELCAEMDGIVGELNSMRKKGGNVPISSSSEAAALGVGSLLGTSPSSQATKRRGDSPSKSKIAEESPRLGKLRKRSSAEEEGDEDDEEEEEEFVPLNAELEEKTGKTKSENEEDLRRRIVELEKALKEAQQPKSNEEGSGDKCLNCAEIEQTLEMMRREFESLEDYWQGKLNEERLLFEDEQRVNDDKFNELLQKMLEYEEQFSSTLKKDGEGGSGGGRLTPIEEKDVLEQQYMDLEEELDGLKRILREKNEEIKLLRSDAKQKQLPSIAAASEPFNVAIDQTSPPESPASSPINYLWSQSTIQAPARDYQNPVWQRPKKEKERELEMSLDVEETPIVVAPIQKPKPGSLLMAVENCDRDSVASSTDRHSAATYNVSKPRVDGEEEEAEKKEAVKLEGESEEANGKTKDVIDAVDEEEVNEHLKKVRSLYADCKELTHLRDALLNELQQLKEMRPSLEKNFARTIHPSLTSRIQQLEQRNRQLQALLKQQQVYNESIMHQTWQQQRVEIADLRTRLESQGLTVADQVQRLAKADILVKELFVENSHLRANIQRLGQQSMRSNFMFQPHPGAPPGMNGVPSFP